MKSIISIVISGIRWICNPRVATIITVKFFLIAFSQTIMRFNESYTDVFQIMSRQLR